MRGKRRRAEGASSPSAAARRTATTSSPTPRSTAACTRRRCAATTSSTRTRPPSPGASTPPTSRGASLGTLCKALNAEGVPTPGNGARWLPPTVRLILMNPAYKGEPVSGRQKCHTDEGRLSQVHKLTGRALTSPDARACPRRGSAHAVRAGRWWTRRSGTPCRRGWRRAGQRRVPAPDPAAVRPDVLPPLRRPGRDQVPAGEREELPLPGLPPAPRSAGGRGGAALRGRRVPGLRGGPGGADCRPQAWESPASLAAALAVYRRSLPHPAAVGRPGRSCAADRRGAGRSEAGGDGADPGAGGGHAGRRVLDAYAELFADLAARRKDLEGRRQELTRAPRRERGGRAAGGGDAGSAALAHPGGAVGRREELFNDPRGAGVGAARHPHEDRGAASSARRGGADVIFRPGLFGEEEDGGPEGEPGGGGGPGNCSHEAGSVLIGRRLRDEAAPHPLALLAALTMPFRDTIQGYQRSATRRLEDTRELLEPPTLDAQRSDADRRHLRGAMYLAGYAAECLVKAYLIQHMNAPTLAAATDKLNEQRRQQGLEPVEQIARTAAGHKIPVSASTDRPAAIPCL